MLCCASTPAAAHSPQTEGSDTQQRPKGPGWEFLLSCFCCQESTLIMKCWVHLGGKHLPIFLVEASYCVEKLPNYMRPGRRRANAKGSICSATVQVIGFARCWSPSFVVLDHQLRWLSSANPRAQLGWPHTAAAGVLEIQG